MFLSTPYDFEAVDYLDEFMSVFKISSSDLTNIPFIKYVAGKNKPILLSTGASTIKEIKDAVKAIAVDKINDGSLDSIQKIKIIDEVLGTDLYNLLVNG